MLSNDYTITLVTNEKEVGKWTVDPAIFAQSSMKFKRELTSRPNSYRFVSNYDPEIFGIYVDACQERNFKVTEDTAYPLLRIAKEWETPELVRGVSDFIARNCVHKPYLLTHRPKGYHDMVYPVDPVLFAKASDKFREIYAKYPEEYVVEDETTPSVFLTLIRACQKRACHTSADEVYELRELAEEWGVSIVKNYCDRKIKEFKLEETPEEDAIELLFSNIRNGEDVAEAIDLIVEHINYYIKQERFTEIPTKLIYEILTKAEVIGVDQNELIKTVLTKLDMSPQTAVPLILRLNFNKLTENEYDEIFGNGEIHNQNINYYTAMALSSVYENTRIYLDNFDARFAVETKKVLEEIDRDHYNIFLKSKKAKEIDFQKINVALNEQQAHIDDLTRVLELQTQALTEALIRARDAPSNQQLQRRAQFSINKSIKKCGKKLVELIDASDARAQDILNDLLEKYQTILEEAVSKIGDIEPEKKAIMQDQKTLLEAIDKRNRALNDEMHSIRTYMAAKIVRDKVRGDQFLRKVENRYNILDDPGLWSVSLEEFEIAESEIAKLEEELQKTFPIQQTQV
jgi:hypothetical protein